MTVVFVRAIAWRLFGLWRVDSGWSGSFCLIEVVQLEGFDPRSRRAAEPLLVRDARLCSGRQGTTNCRKGPRSGSPPVGAHQCVHSGFIAFALELVVEWNGNEEGHCPCNQGAEEFNPPKHVGPSKHDEPAGYSGKLGEHQRCYDPSYGASITIMPLCEVAWIYELKCGVNNQLHRP